MAEPASPGRRLRPFLIALAVIALLGLVLRQSAPRLARQGLLLVADAYDLEPRSLEVRRVGWRRIEITKVVLGKANDIEIDELVASYKPQDLIPFHIESVLVRNLRVRARVDRDGLAPGVLATLLAGERSAGIRLDNARIEDAGLDLESPFGTARVRFEGQGSKGPEGITLHASASADEERLTARLAFTPAVEAKTEGAEEGERFGGAFPAGRGMLRIAGRGATVAGVVTDLHMNAGLDFSSAGSEVRIWSPGGAEVRAGSLDADFMKQLSLPESIREALGERLELTLGSAAEDAPLVQLQRSEEGWRIAWDGGAAIRTSRGGAVDAKARGTVRVSSKEGEPPHVLLSPVAVRASGWKLSVGTLDGGEVRLEGEGALDAFEGELRGSGRGRAVATDAPGGLPVEASLQARLSLDSHELRVTPGNCLTVRVGDIALAKFGVLKVEGLCLAPAPDAPLVSVALEDRRPRGISVQGSFRPAPFRFRTEGEAARLGALAGEMPEVTLAVEGTAISAMRFRMQGEGGRLTAPEPGLAARNVKFDLAGSTADGLAIKGSFGVEEVAGVGKRPLLAPLGLTGRLEMSDGEVDFEGSLGNRGGGLSLTVAGEHSLKDGRGLARITLEPLHFKAGSLRPADLVPALGRRIESANGAIDAAGTFRWGPGFLRTPLRVRVKRLGFESAGMKVKGIEGEVRFLGILPPETRPGQEVSLDRAESGVALTEGRVVFGITDEGRVEIESLAGRSLGGALSGGGWVDWKGDRGEVQIRVAGLQLADLLEVIDVKGLTGSGELGGSIPLEISNLRIDVREARLKGSGEGGWIRYRPAGRPGFLPGGDDRMDLTLAILEDFRYDSLEVGLDGPLFEEIDLAIDLLGNNPEVEGGQPVELHVRVSGYLLDLLRGATATTRISESLGRRLRESGVLPGE